MLDSWKRVKKSGSYYRELNKYRKDVEKRASEIREELEKKRICVVPSVVSTKVVTKNIHQQIFVQNNQNIIVQPLLPPTIVSHLDSSNNSSATTDDSVTVDESSSGI